MRSEFIGLTLSFIALIAIPCVIVIASAVLQRLRNQSRTSTKELLQSSVAATATTVIITLAMTVVLKASGFFDRNFYRPTKRDHGVQNELELQPESVNFTSADGTLLHGWFLSSEGESLGTVICFHGSDLNITYTTRNVHWLTRNGFNVFVFDYRGYGQSKGTPDRRGLVDDSAAAIDYISSRDDLRSDQLILYGQSMGGQLALNAAAIRQEAGIRLVIAEATYASQSLHLSDKLGQLGPLWLVKWAGWLLTSDQYSGESAIENLPATPVLLVHGSADTVVMPYHSERLFDAAAGPKDIWRYDGLGHLKVFKKRQPQERLVNFIQSKLPSVPEPTADASAMGASQRTAEGVLKHYPGDVKSRQAWRGHHFPVAAVAGIPTALVTKEELMALVGHEAIAEGNWYPGEEWKTNEEEPWISMPSGAAQGRVVFGDGVKLSSLSPK